MAPIWKPRSHDLLTSWVNAILDEAQDELNEWELKFISDIEYKLSKGHVLSEKQEFFLEKIYAEKTK